MNVVKKLQSIGLQINPYKRGPLGKYNFAININGKYLRIWEGSADITVSTDKRRKQAVITVVEKPRKIRTLSMLYHSQPTPDHIRSNAYVSVPNSRMKILSHVEYSGSRHKYEIEFTTRTTRTSFLVGYDTGAEKPFISQLKNVVKTVSEAHEELLPKDTKLKKGYKRQGEFFFNPVSKELSKQLTFNIHNVRKEAPLNFSFNYTNTSSHRGAVIRYNGKNYVIGKVWDTRKDRHNPLYLHDWYEVVRNNEVRVSYYTTWD